VPPASRLRRPGLLDAGPFAADVASFELHLAAENKAAGTIRIYTQAPRWFAAAHLLPETGKTRWDQVDTQDIQRWVVWLLRHYSENYACRRQRPRRPGVPPLRPRHGRLILVCCDEGAADRTWRWCGH
jgi:hypothetical protein